MPHSVENCRLSGNSHHDQNEFAETAVFEINLAIILSDSTATCVCVEVGISELADIFRRLLELHRTLLADRVCIQRRPRLHTCTTNHLQHISSTDGDARLEQDGSTGGSTLQQGMGML